jgi:hypothetical protein
MKGKKRIAVLAVPVGKEPEVQVIDNDLKSLQEFVGGQICAQGIAPRLMLYANDDGLQLGLPYNRCGFVGNFLIATISSAGNEIAMTDKDVATAKEWLARNDHRPPFCHMCGRMGGVTLFCPCRAVLIYCVECYNLLGEVMNGTDLDQKKRYGLCPRCQQEQRE